MIDILQQFTVNSIELTVFMLLWSKFSLKNENNWFKNLFIILIGGGIMIATSGMNTYLNVFISFISLISLVKFAYKKLFIKTTLEFVIFYSVNIVLQSILITLATLIGFKYSDTFIMNITLTFLQLVFVIFILRCNFAEKAKNFLEIDSKILYYFVINLGLYSLFSKFVWEYNQNIILNNLPVYILIVLLMLSTNIFLYYHIIKISEDKKVLEVQNKYAPILIDIVEDIRRKQHDFKNHLNTINAIVEISSPQEVKHELKKYISSLKCSNSLIEDILYIDNIIIKAIIYNKLSEADRLNIKLLFNVTNNSLENSLNDYEISDVLNNLLDNAFEAIRNSSNDKIVILNILTEGSSNIVEVKNSGITIKPNNIRNIFDIGFSTKEGKNRGYGLYNIKRIVEKTGSDLQLFFEDNYTVFKISFKQPSMGSRFSTKHRINNISVND
ncbi:GHKL domain-containing protein [Clostridium estertheticum]|uniref:sensor histidine kinase n=1 Tax=Clostridium estertheticum TaxID=238834 RepID=UPI0013E95ED6|nr:GHKL domain-containing protein [Clostridium estertheticum]MBZ9685395.1 GHKL domain-containing protein [Clostridium estertheticum]